MLYFSPMRFKPAPDPEEYKELVWNTMLYLAPQA